MSEAETFKTTMKHATGEWTSRKTDNDDNHDDSDDYIYNVIDNCDKPWKTLVFWTTVIIILIKSSGVM